MGCRIKLFLKTRYFHAQFIIVHFKNKTSIKYIFINHEIYFLVQNKMLTFNGPSKVTKQEINTNNGFLIIFI